MLRSALALSLLAATVAAQGSARLLGWNDLGMHCMDGDTSVFSILPPYNTFHAQLMVGGQLASSGTYSVTYEAVADATGSINKSSIGKTDFWQHAQALFGATLQLDEGLRGYRMPGAANTPQNMTFQTGMTDYIAEGVPVTPYDDNNRMNPYPLMRLVARNGQGQAIAHTDVVVPVSAEMACVSCHGSGSNPQARPTNGWVYGSAAVDDRLNILKLHDDLNAGNPLYASALTQVGFSSLGLYDTVVNQGQPVLCAACHGSIALGASGVSGVSALTAAMHSRHGQARMADGRLLDSVTDRSSCYTCHPGAATRCLRGAMGKAIGADGLEKMSCQDCHGSMSEVGNAQRTGWLQEPNCQNCHTGDANQNAGAIRFDNAFDLPGHLRVTSNPRFATTPDAPASGLSLYRFSVGHGGLECSACHGSTHAIWPASTANDNKQAIDHQGHKGTIIECRSCHTTFDPETQLDGPHGMHAVGQEWVSIHQDIAEQQGTSGCRACHGTTGRGTELSRAQADRTVSTQFGTRTFWRGYQVGCYECHNGPNSENAINNQPPVVQNRTELVPTDLPLAMTLSATDPNSDPLTLRIVEQPQHGAVAFDGTNAVYRAWDGYVGPDSFTYAASDNKRNSNLGTVSITVQAAACPGGSQAFGYGCGLPDGSVPQIHADGCGVSGQSVDVTMTGGSATGFAVFALGYGRGIGELGGDGCTLRVQTLIGISPLIALNAGNATHAIAVPAALGTFDATMQGFCFSTVAPRGYIATPGLEVRFR